MIHDNSHSLVSIGCSICGGTFRIPRKATEMVGHPDRGYGVETDRETDCIRAKSFYRPRKELDNTLSRFVKRNTKPVSFHIGWHAHANNIDMCPGCALSLLIATLSQELMIYEEMKGIADKQGEEIVTKFVSDLDNEDNNKNDDFKEFLK